MTLPPRIQELVERFRENREAYRSGSYNETQIRREFIDPLFEELGWDIDNAQGYAEAYKDVIHEDAIKIGGNTKAPDYAFRVGGTRKFFLEAKKPAVNIRDDIHPAYQLRRYAWSAKLPLSILTDFEEFAVYDCRIKPEKTDKASVARIAYFTFESYDEKWNEMAAVFSRNAILKGSFDKYADDNKRKRGTAEVDDAFLAEIESWREKLARNIALRNPTLSARELNTAVQRTIDRIIFLRIAEDRAIEPYGRLQTLKEGKYVYTRLATFFRQADDRYNSGLFHFRQGDGSEETLDNFTLGLKIDDKVLKDILSSLYYPESPYEFSVLPADILGQVYEQFLGKVISLSGTRAVIEEKPEVKKAGGVYYTPTYIVQYIIQNTLGEFLNGKTPAQVAGLDKRLKSARPLRILDPACGSGSFLIEAYQYLLDWYRDQYAREDPERSAKGKSPKLYQAPGGEWRLTIAERRRILLNHIFGVDIDHQAVEVTKLSLLLKVLEGERADAIASQMDMFHIRALPDLASNIKCGNSLIGPEFYDAFQESMFDDNQRFKINVFRWGDEFDDIIRGGGFDVVIGNPPYGADYTKQEKEFFQSRFSYKKGKPETYLFFVEVGFNLLRTGGRLGYITPNAWLTNYYGRQMRDFVLRNSQVMQIVDLEPTRVFEAAVVDTAILITRKSKTQGSIVRIFRGTTDHKIKFAFEARQEDWLKDDDLLINVHASMEDVSLLRKIELSKRTLGELAEYSQGVIPYKTKEDGKKNAYIGPIAKDSTWKPLIESANQVQRFVIETPRAHIKYGKWLWCAREPKYFDREKILFHRVRKKMRVQLVGAIDSNQAVNRHSLSNLILKNENGGDKLWALLAIFNSKIANWWFVKTYGLLMEVGGFKVEKIPLPIKWEKSWKKLAEEARNLTNLRKKVAGARDETSRRNYRREYERAEERLEKLVASAYDLTADDITRVTAYGSLAEEVEGVLEEEALEDGAAETTL